MTIPWPAQAPDADLLVADIGSTITKLAAFKGIGAAVDNGQIARYLGQGHALSTVAEGDVTLGLDAARRDLEGRLGVRTEGAPLMATASAAGGLRMSVHGLTAAMTLRAAREASLGAGAIVVHTTAGAIDADDLATIRRVAPNLILLAGGVDHGDREVVIGNSKRLAELGLATPVIYAGNQAARAAVQRNLERAGIRVFVVDNVYPRIDELNVEPVRERIQDVFARHITTAPGMERVKLMVEGDVLPTPGAVMRATEMLAGTGEACLRNDVLCIDVGGATTDVHSVTDGSPANAPLRMAPEPRSKRTVEGDLGVYLNAANLVVAAAAQHRPTDVSVEAVKAMPDDAPSHAIAVALTRLACNLAVWRHAGERRPSYGGGRPELIEGRDLTAIRAIVGTGGALTRLGCGEAILSALERDPRGRKLLPPEGCAVLIDQHYVMAAVGVLSQRYPQAARAVLRASLGLEREAVRSDA